MISQRSYFPGAFGFFQYEGIVLSNYLAMPHNSFPLPGWPTDSPGLHCTLDRLHRFLQKDENKRSYFSSSTVDSLDFASYD